MGNAKEATNINTILIGFANLAILYGSVTSANGVLTVTNAPTTPQHGKGPLERHR